MIRPTQLIFAVFFLVPVLFRTASACGSEAGGRSLRLANLGINVLQCMLVTTHELTHESMFNNQTPKVVERSRLLRRGSVDGRTSSGRYLRSVEAKLIQQLGGSPNLSQMLLIRRAAALSLQAQSLETQMAREQPIDALIYSTITNSLSRVLLRLQASRPKHSRNVPKLADALASSSRERTSVDAQASAVGLGTTPAATAPPVPACAAQAAVQHIEPAP